MPFSIDNALEIIVNECNTLYKKDSTGEQVNKFYVSLRLAVESTLKIIIFKKKPDSDLSNETLANLIIHIRLVPEFKTSFNSFLTDAKKFGNVDAHDVNRNFQFMVYRVRLFEYLEWFFESFLKINMPDSLSSWYNNHQEIEEAVKNSNANRIVPEINETQNAEQSPQIIDISNQETSATNPEVGSSVNSTYQSPDNRQNKLAEDIAKLDTQRRILGERKKQIADRLVVVRKEITESSEKTRLRKLIKPITGNVVTDFFMIAGLQPWVIIKNNKIIFKKKNTKIIIDFSNETISETSFLKTKRINYVEVIKEEVSSAAQENNASANLIDFSLQQADNESNYNFQIDFVFGYYIEAKFSVPMKLGQNSQAEKENVYLLFCYLLSYMYGMSLTEIIAIDKMKSLPNSKRFSLFDLILLERKSKR